MAQDLSVASSTYYKKVGYHIIEQHYATSLALIVAIVRVLV